MTAVGAAAGPAEFDKVHEHLQTLCLDMARETLHSEDLELFHQSDQALYTFLADYFERIKDRQRHEDSIAITAANCTYVLRDLFGQGHLASAATNLAERKAMEVLKQVLPADVPDDDEQIITALETVRSTAAGPLMSQRTLREHLQQANVNVSALSEVLELCRLLDTRFQHSVPFGQVNVCHAAAVLCTLLPCRTLYDLLSHVFDALPPTRGSATGPDGRPGSARGTAVYRAADLQKIRIFHCWATIDSVNAASLQRLQVCLLRRSNLTLPLLVDFMPSLRHIDSIAHGAAVAAEGAQGKTVVYGESDAPAAAAGPAAVASYSEHDDGPRGHHDEGSDGDGEEEGDDGPIDESANAFWSALVSEPQAEEPSDGRQ
jgi:hypothetical protein